MRKVISLILIFGLLFSVLTACNNSEETTTSPTTTPQQEEQKEMTVLIRMMDMQDKWFRDNIIKPFEKEHNVKLNVVTFDKESDVEAMIKLETESGNNKIGLVKTPHTMLYPLVEKNYVIPLDEIVSADQLKQDLSEYTDLAVELGTIDGKTYYIPRKLETNTLLYLKSKVDDAVKNWTKFEADIQAAFKQENGFGLPSGFTLEADPNQWDFYDLAVVGYYWANTEYDGLKTPKIAHRGMKYEGTTVEQITKIYQMGGTAEDIVKMNTQPVVDFYNWEVFYRKNNLYNPGMWEQGWSGGGIWKAFSEGQVYLAFMHQIDAFFIHGGSNPEMAGYLADPDDMGIAIMPQGASLEIKDGQPVRVGTHKSQLAGWWWSIPKTTPDAKLSYELARWITNAENHKNESSTFGMLPIRKDVVNNINDSFNEPWMQEVFNIGAKQMEAGVEQVPQVKNYPGISNNYLEAWYEIVVDQNYKDISGVLEKYAAKNAELVK